MNTAILMLILSVGQFAFAQFGKLPADTLVTSCGEAAIYKRPNNSLYISYSVGGVNKTADCVYSLSADPNEPFNHGATNEIYRCTNNEDTLIHVTDGYGKSSLTFNSTEKIRCR